VTLPAVGLSLINDTPEEILYFSVRGLSVVAEDARENQFLWLSLDQLQLDNQSVNARYPVILAGTPLKPEAWQPLLQCSLTSEKTDSSNSVPVVYFNYLLQSIDIKVEEDLIWALQGYGDSIARELGKTQERGGQGEREDEASTFSTPLSSVTEYTPSKELSEVKLALSMPLCLSVHVLVYLAVQLSDHLVICCLSVCSLVCLFACLSAHLCRMGGIFKLPACTWLNASFELGLFRLPESTAHGV
jgi:hypothetical protein